MHQYLKDEARVDKETAAKDPDKFKSARNWKIFAEALETYLSQLYGSGHVLLSYVIRGIIVAPPDQAYETHANKTMLGCMELSNNWSWKVLALHSSLVQLNS